MEPTKIRCPETGELEDVELDRTPLGVVVAGCSRLCSEGETACTRDCTRELDLRDHRDVDDQDRVLIILAGRHPPTDRLAETLVACLARDRIVAERARLDAGQPPPLADYDAVVIGAPMLLGRHAKAVADFLRDHERELAAMPTFLFAVGVSGLSTFAGYATRMTRRTGWIPTATASFTADEIAEAEIEELARRIADELPAPVLQPVLA